MPSKTKTAAEVMSDQLDEMDKLAAQTENSNESEPTNGGVDMTEQTTVVEELNDTPSLNVKNWEWTEFITNEDDDFKNESGHIALFPKGTDPLKKKAKMLGNNIPLIAREAISAFASIRQDRYKLVTTGFVALNSEAESVDAVTAYSLKTCSGQVVMDGELIDVPVPTGDGISFLADDPVFGYQEKYFVDRKWAFEVLCQKEYKLTPKQKYLAQAFWKIYATQIFATQPVVKIHVGHKTLPYVRKVLMNVDDPVASKEAMDQAMYDNREYQRNKAQLENPNEDGSLRTKNGSKPAAFDYKPRLLVVEQVGRRVSKVEIIAESDLEEDAFLKSSPKEVAVIKRTEGKNGVVRIKTKISQPIQLVTLYSQAARDGNDLAILS